MPGKYLTTLAVSGQIAKMFQDETLNGMTAPRIALLGRSNVGKSSLINGLLGMREARTSKQPGKTRSINFFQWEPGKQKPTKILADLPGYGFAKRSQDERDLWRNVIQAYFKADKNLERVLLLLDARHGPTDLDLEALAYILAALEGSATVITPVMTKTDSLKTQSERARRQREVVQSLEQNGIPAEAVLWVSVRSKDGLYSLEKELTRDG